MGRRALPSVATGLLVASAVSAAAASAVAAPVRETGRLVVLTDRGAGAIASVARPSGRAVPQIGLLTVRPRRGESLRAAARRLRARPGIVAVEAERRLTPRALPDDPALHLPDPSAGGEGGVLPAATPLAWPLLRSGFPAAWEVTRGERALVGVIDTGVDPTHPELAGKLASVVDQRAPGAAPEPDGDGHGTHVASLACAATGNGLGSAGAGHDCRLLIERTDLSDASIAAALVDATDRGAHAINMSFGDDGLRPTSPALLRALRYAANRDVVLVAAAADEPVTEQGDPSGILQPTGSGPTLAAGLGLSVTAATYAGRRAAFAGYGSQISLAAYGAAGRPGSSPPGLVGAFPAQPTSLEQEPLACGCRTAIAGDPRYAYLSGTSMAAPQVAATAALVRALNPDLRGAEVVTLLKRTARRPAGTGWTDQLGWGILDAGRAVRTARRIDRGAPAATLTAAPGRRAGAVALRWTAVDEAPPDVLASGVRAVELHARRLPAVDNGGGQDAGAGDAHWRRVVAGAGRALVFEGVPGARYAFSARAIDRAGNRERGPVAEVVVRAPR